MKARVDKSSTSLKAQETQIKISTYIYALFESTRVSERAYEFQAKHERKFELSETVILVWPARLNRRVHWHPWGTVLRYIPLGCLLQTGED